jgi:predicted negative regulator of RcsB-dependent stress response
MNAKVKMSIYAILLILAVWFGWGFFSNYSSVTKAPVPEAPADNTNTNVVAGNASTNAPAAASSAPTAPQHAEQGKMIGYLAGFVIVIIGIGIMIAHDVTQVVGSAALDALLDVDSGTDRDPDYEKAEAAWAKGNHLDAIQLMREFLKKNPRAQYAALRIAEIYEKDLNNHLAAALEYEEILKKKLPPERWGWAAIHLCNLHSKLGQQDKTVALLQRIVAEYPQTAAAKKARSKLGIAEPDPAEVAAPEEGEAPTSDEETEAAPEPATPPKSNLPPGFRPK